MTMQPHIRISKVSKVFSTGDREVVALDDINLDIKPGEFICLLGPSGCGKSTLLNAVAGFSLPTTGRSFHVNGAVVRSPGPDRGMVFQEYALFPWMTVEKNIAFGLEIQEMKATKAQSARKSLELLKMLHRLPRPLPERPVRRHAPARRDRPRAGARFPDHADGRALRRAGLAHPAQPPAGNGHGAFSRCSARDSSRVQRTTILPVSRRIPLPARSSERAFSGRPS